VQLVLKISKDENNNSFSFILLNLWGTTMTATNHDGHSNDGHNHDGTVSKPKRAFV